MSGEEFTPADLEHMERLGITEAEARRQLAIFKKGPRNPRLQRPCTLGDGIVVLDSNDHERLVAHWEKAAAKGRLSEFVPASGAATRMFAFLQRVRSRLASTADASGVEGDIETDGDKEDFRLFIDSLREFAFFEALAEALAQAGIPWHDRMEAGHYAEILDYLLDAQGLNYGSLPKALIPFHRYPDHSRTALEEHLVEATHTVQDSSQLCRLHFTVSADIEAEVVEQARRAAVSYGDRFGVRYELSFSIQSPATNTMAVDPENRPFRQQDGSLLFRPGGHGALLENLNQLQGDIVFIKNIDNVVTDDHRGPVLRHQRVLAGMLLELQDEAFRYLRLLRSGSIKEKDLDEMLDFVTNDLSASPADNFSHLRVEEKAASLFQLLNRPFRVCGMVKNRGEPGGGPFWVQEPANKISLQIIEGAQVDQSLPEQVAVFNDSTHFSPVRLVCGLRDFEGQPFNLQEFVDQEAVFIAHKTDHGKKLKALELPGLWNGGMADWNTVFVEIPEETFNPVKTLNDLLRPAHRAK